MRLRCLREQALVRIEVLDTGVGIPADQLRYIFDELHQLGVATDTSRDGFGRGLSIVQRLVKLLDLKLDVRSEVGKESAFFLELLSPPPPAASLCVDAQRCDAPWRRSDRPRVLLVEDDSAVRDATRMLLYVEGYYISGDVEVWRACLGMSNCLCEQRAGISSLPTPTFSHVLSVRTL